MKRVGRRIESMSWSRGARRMTARNWKLRSRRRSVDVDLCLQGRPPRSRRGYRSVVVVLVDVGRGGDGTKKLKKPAERREGTEEPAGQRPQGDRNSSSVTVDIEDKSEQIYCQYKACINLGARCRRD